MFVNQFEKPHTSVHSTCDVVFVADFFAEDLIGGAELTTEALIESSPFRVFKLRSREVSMKNLEEGHGKYWIFGNWAGLDKNLIPTIVANMKYSVLEYDYKFCKYRSPEKHTAATGTEKPVPVPPISATAADNTSLTLYKHPPLRITTPTTAPPLTVISA